MKRLILVLTLSLAGWAFGGEIDLSIKNPSIEKLQARILARAAKIEQWKNSGVIGEESTGLLKQRDAGSLGLGEKKEVRDLIVSENEDRYALFRELLLASGLKETNLDQVAGVYAKSRRQAAAPAHWVETADRKWVQKKDLKE
ncbi:MAG TPA: DUF1318 domain-containing protein [Planctomycetota bacterium]|nr:DUF1318 domain-containing protein [Planctomycetota bacterium]